MRTVRWIVPLSNVLFKLCNLPFMSPSVLLLQPPGTVSFDSNGGWVCVADKGKMNWSRGCHLCKKAGGSWWYSWKAWWSCSRWRTLTALCFSTRCSVTHCGAKVPLFFTPLRVCPAVTSLAFSSCCFLLNNFTVCSSDLVWHLLFHPFPHPLFPPMLPTLWPSRMRSSGRQ